MCLRLKFGSFSSPSNDVVVRRRSYFLTHSDEVFLTRSPAVQVFRLELLSIVNINS
jgi:hypothetical protein